MRSRAASAAALGAVCCLLVGCGSSSNRQQVRAKVHEFAVAVAHKDAKKICTDVFAPSLVRRFKSVGVSCERGMKIFLADLNDPTLAVGKVTVQGSRASAAALSGASGQRTALRTLVLVKTSSGWRIAGLRAAPGASSSASQSGGANGKPKTTTTKRAPSKGAPSKHAPSKHGSASKTTTKR